VTAYVDCGPASICQNHASPDNYLFVDLNVCQPQTTTCVKIDHVHVSTAISGLRILASALSAAEQAQGVSLTLTPEPDPSAPSGSGNTLADCVQLPTESGVGTAFGSVVTAVVQITGQSVNETTTVPVPIQLIATPTTSSPKPSCDQTGFINTVADLGANGVIGIGPLMYDCSGSGCVTQYYSCTPAGNCSANISAAPSDPAVLVTNPVTKFATDNNGVIIELTTAVDPTQGAPSYQGTIVFGIGTESNNALTGVKTVLAADPSSGAITTTYTLQGQSQGTQFTNSWFDTGSYANLFTDSGIPTCQPNSPSNPLATFYCPSTALNLQATVTGSGGTGSATVSFTVANAQTLVSGSSIVFSSIAAQPPADGYGGTNPFIWGLPFFFGQNVYIGFTGASVANGSSTVNGPFYAF